MNRLDAYVPLPNMVVTAQYVPLYFFAALAGLGQLVSHRVKVLILNRVDEPLGRNNCWDQKMSIAQLIGNFRLLASLPAFLVYYFFYSSFDSQNPEGQIRDTKVIDLIYRLLLQSLL